MVVTSWPEIFAVSAALVFAAVICIGQWRSRCMDPLDKLPPLTQGRRPNEGYGKQ